jgi:hypothetical protein
MSKKNQNDSVTGALLAMQKQMFELLQQQDRLLEAERRRAIIANLPFVLWPPRGQA